MGEERKETKRPKGDGGMQGSVETQSKRNKRQQETYGSQSPGERGGD